MTSKVTSTVTSEMLTTLLKRGPVDPLQVRPLLQQEQEEIANAFHQGTPAKTLIRRRSETIDELLQTLWQQQIGPHCQQCALIAVGGYGRQELHPHSDIDLLILAESEDEAINNAIGSFVTLLWDLGLQIGHSVRSIQSCIDEGQQDVTIATNLLEARLLVGSEAYFNQLQHATQQDDFWASGPFFIAKRNEQQARLSKYNDTAYNLEPNIKEGPGGLRDIQNILWVTHRHFGSDGLKELVEHHFLTQSECAELDAGRERLWEIRFALHLIAGRAEERLLFEHQPELAQQFGHIDNENGRGIEGFMHSYFRIIRGLSRLNEMLLQLFEEQLLTPPEQREPHPIDAHFGRRSGYLTLLQPDALEQNPGLALTLFQKLQTEPNLKGVTAETIRQLRNNRQRIAEHYQQTPEARRTFSSLFCCGTGLTHTLRRMNRYSLLGTYLPEFEKIIGLMQHDLFHAYTVDEHTLFVVRNLRRLTVSEHYEELPHLSDLIIQLKHPEQLYIAGLFHDIAKGRGGNHSQLGVAVVQAFCKHHQIEQESADEIAWLVEQHLQMSTFAQRRDIDDPDEIEVFAQIVGKQSRLDMLYLLTTADIRATNKTLWNHFKSALLTKLYNATTALLSRPELEIDYGEETRQQALEQLIAQEMNPTAIGIFWEGLGDDYFQKHDAEEICWHTTEILTHTPRPLICFHKKSHQGGSEILIYHKDQQFLFAILVHTLEALHLDIQAARINTTQNSHALDIFTVLDQNGKTLSDPELLQRIEQQLRSEISEPTLIHQPITFRRSRHQKHFHNKGRVIFRQDERKQQTVLEVHTTDRPGLLSTLCQTFMACNIRIHAAKITTLGERAEDIFWVTHQDNTPLSDEEIEGHIAPYIRKTLQA